jgi:hypothetical protein
MQVLIWGPTSHLHLPQNIRADAGAAEPLVYLLQYRCFSMPWLGVCDISDALILVRDAPCRAALRSSFAIPFADFVYLAA